MGDDWSFGGDDYDMSSIFGDGGGSDYNVTDWWDSTGGATDSGDWAYGLGNGDYGSYLGGDTGVAGFDLGSSGGSAASAAGGFNWGSLMGMGMQMAGNYMASAGAQKMSKEQLELMSRLRREEYAAQLAEQEKYYQSHGKELSAALGNYSQFSKPKDGPSPFAQVGAAQSPFPMANMQPGVPPQGLLAYGY